MLLKKNRQSLRGLSHQEKVKKLQKLTRVPLQNFKTNIVQSDLEEDDVSLPISLKMSINANQQSQGQYTNRYERKDKRFNQQQINKTIRAMTQELFTLQSQKQKSPMHHPQTHQRTLSIFSVESVQLEQSNRQDRCFEKTQTLKDFYSTSKNQTEGQNPCLKELSQISGRLDNIKNESFVHQQTFQRKRQKQQRQTEPINSNPENQATNNLFSKQLDAKNRKDELQSQISKRFSRNKRDSNQLNQQKILKKLKFNRSNQKNKQLNNAINKENDQNIYTAKKALFTERLSFETIPSYETLENELKKRKAMGKKFMSFQNQNPIEKAGSQHQIGQQKQKVSDGHKNSLKQLIMQYEQISKNQEFKKLQEGKIGKLVQTEKGKDFLLQLFTKYRSSIEVLRSLQ